MEIEKIDNELYKANYILKKTEESKKVWYKIKNNPEILREATEIKRNKFDSGYTVKGLAICDAMLVDYENADENAYNNLIKSIYTNTDIARIVLDGASNGGFSFLLMSLWNHNLKLTEEQKAFAVNEAMNKIGTTRWHQREEEFSKKLDDMGISDNNTTYINIDGCVNPIGQKSGSEYMNNMFDSLSNEQAHGTGEFDIRYQILRNPNWSLKEKQKLIMDFWHDDKTYDEYLEQWEWGIVNDSANYIDDTEPLDKSELYNYSYNEFLEIYKDKKLVNKIWEEIQFCKQMHELRPQKRELEYIQKKILKQL